MALMTASDHGRRSGQGAPSVRSTSSIGNFVSPPALTLRAMSRLLQCSKEPHSLVGDGEDARRNCQAERPRGVEIDHEFQLGRPHYRQISGLLSFENPAAVDTNLVISVSDPCSLTHQSASPD